MTEQDAVDVAAWRYPGEYAFYNWDADPDDLPELLNPSGWGHQYFAVDGPDRELAGFLGLKVVGSLVEIGLGLRPDLTGRGLGLPFVEAGLAFAADRYGETPSFTLSVAAFNHRAISVYRRAGFEIVSQYQHETNGGVHLFNRMDRAPNHALDRPPAP